MFQFGCKTVKKVSPRLRIAEGPLNLKLGTMANGDGRWL